MPKIIVNIGPYLIFLALYAFFVSTMKKLVRKWFQKDKKALALNFLIQFVSVIVYFTVSVIVLSYIFPLHDFFKTIMTGSGVAVAVLAFVCQESVSNIISGILIIFSSSYMVGDIISIPDKQITGKIWDITLSQTEIMSFGNNKIIIPNKVMANSVIERKRENRNICNFLTFYVDYSTDIDLVEQIVKDLARNHPYYIDVRNSADIGQGKEDIGFSIISFDERGILIRVSTWSKAENGFYLCCELRRQILTAFKENKIRFPHTQIDIRNIGKTSHKTHWE